MPDNSTLYTVTGVRTRTLYVLLKNARILQLYLENEMQRAFFVPKARLVSGNILFMMCCHKGPQKLRKIPNVCRLRPSFHLLFHNKHNISKTASLLALRLKEGRGERCNQWVGPTVTALLSPWDIVAISVGPSPFLTQNTRFGRRDCWT